MQSLLGTLFEKVRDQADTLEELQAEVAAAKGSSLKDRLALLEERFNAVLGPPGTPPKFNPFMQQQLSDRVGYAEGKLDQHTHEVDELQREVHEVRFAEMRGVQPAAQLCKPTGLLFLT